MLIADYYQGRTNSACQVMWSNYSLGGWVAVSKVLRSSSCPNPNNVMEEAMKIQIVSISLKNKRADCELVAMATYLPTRTYNTLGYKWSLNPGPWNAKEHALIVVSYWGSVGYSPLIIVEPS